MRSAASAPPSPPLPHPAASPELSFFSFCEAPIRGRVTPRHSRQRRCSTLLAKIHSSSLSLRQAY